ncbi:MAG: hypothetical protein CVT75_09565 [Alphaproteobacteria bacterium HGW-Alphaproteobacteria-14]|nr:MAG: hypothetical protein CVT75_09565 [Alphaproteobacteria bacterium HGW-Alphaproteobacteria-14]
MSEPVTFTSSTPNIGLPLLIAGQAQKEFFLNQSLVIIDSLYRGSVIASQPAPPSNADEGDCFRVTAPASLGWEDCEDHIAIRIGGSWHFIAPREGMFLFDSAADQFLLYQSGWRVASTPAIPDSGAVIDAEARAAISELIEALRDIGIFAPVSN